MERREIIDMASGIAGGLLLVLAIVLFAVVPQDEPVNPTFRATYVSEEITIDMGSEQVFEEGDTLRFPVTLDSQYMYRITFNVTWTDDVASSLPDGFQFHIIAPDGERVTSDVDTIYGPEPDEGQATGTPPSSYNAQIMVHNVQKSLGAPPRDGPVPGAHLEEDAANARARLLEDLALTEPGEWNLEVYLHEAGDCPAPATDGERAIACGAETQNSPDDGNSLQVVSVTYITYDVQVEEIVA